MGDFRNLIENIMILPYSYGVILRIRGYGYLSFTFFAFLHYYSSVALV